MTTSHLKEIRPDSISPAEQQCRIDVAACYRLIAHYGLSDLSDGFASTRVPDAPQDIVIGGYGLLPELATASCLHRRAMVPDPPLEKHGGVDQDAHRFTRTVLTARPELNAVIHQHTYDSMVFSSLDCELLPMSQWGIMYQGKVAYVPFDTVEVTGQGSCERMAELFAGGMEALILRNHGLLVAGRSVAEAFFALHRLNLACRVQTAAMQTGRKILTPTPEQAAEIHPEFWKKGPVDYDGTREWAGYLRKLELQDPGFRE